MDVPGGDRIAQCMDPQGAVFALHWRNPDLQGS
jgi:predicted enzyme related to lactoylglutathione lyase